MRSSTDRHPDRLGRFADRADLTALLGAFCLFLSAVEYMLPKPLPFMRLGIANLPILLAVDILPFPWFLALAAVKVIGMSLISGTLFSYIALFSLAGTIAAALAMWGVRRAGGMQVSQVGVSIAGAMASNAVQVALASVVVFRGAAWLIAPLFLGMGLATGTALGLFAQGFARASRWYARAAGLPEPASADAAALVAAVPASAETPAGAPGGAPGGKAGPAEAARARRRERATNLFSPGALALTGIAVAVPFLSSRGIPARLAYLALFAAAAWATGKRFSLLTTASVVLGIVGANLLVPTGKVLGQLWGLPITQGALEEGISKALMFEGLMFLSKAAIAPGLRIPGRLGRLVAAAFTYYDRIIEYRGKMRVATLMADADALMLRVWESRTEGARADLGRADLGRADHGRAGHARAEPKKRAAGYAILALAAALSWVVFLVLPYTIP